MNKTKPIELTFTGEFVSDDFGKAFDEIVKQDGRREITLAFDSPEFKQRMEWYAQGFQLWREWMNSPFHEQFRENFNEDNVMCMFCGVDYVHLPDCIYIRAKKLIEEADGVIE